MIAMRTQEWRRVDQMPSEMAVFFFPVEKAPFAVSACCGHAHPVVCAWLRASLPMAISGASQAAPFLFGVAISILDNSWHGFYEYHTLYRVVEK
jgi:hypothetical protein